MKCLGIDWGSQLHALALVDQDAAVLDSWEIEHKPEAVDRLLERLAKEGGPEEVEIAMEPGSALLVDRLFEVGYSVYLINPKQLDRFRDRLAPSGAKDDARDALVAALALARDRDCLQLLEPRSDLAEELVARANARLRLVRRRVDTGNQLRAVLRRAFPAALDLGRDMHDPFFLELLETYPDAKKARGSRASRLGRILRAHRIRALDVQRLCDVLHGPAFPVRESVRRVCHDEVKNLVAQLALLNDQIRRVDKQLSESFEEHPDRDLFLSLPGLGINLAIRVGVRIGRSRFNVLKATTIQCLTGSAPVTFSTGKRPRRKGQQKFGKLIVRMRRACNHDLQADVNQWAAQSLVRSRWAKACYQHLRKKGKGHNAALRTLGYKWVRILAAVMRTRQPYDEERYVATLVRHKVGWAAPLADTSTEAA